jgi:hypothetical protein
VALVGDEIETLEILKLTFVVLLGEGVLLVLVAGVKK